MKFPEVNCGIPVLGPAGIMHHKNTMIMAGITCINHRGGVGRRCPGADAVDFSMLASINGFASGNGIVGREVRAAAVGFTELVTGNHGNGTEAPLPSRNDEVYMGSGFIMRIGLIVSVDDSIDEGSGSLSFCAVAPDGNSSRVHMAKVSAVRQGRQGPKGSEREASCMSTRGRIQLE